MNNDFKLLFAIGDNNEFSFDDEYKFYFLDEYVIQEESEYACELENIIADMEKHPRSTENLFKIANIIAKMEHAEIVKIGKWRYYTNKEFADMLSINIKDIAYDKDLDEGTDDNDDEYLQELTKEESADLNAAVSNTIANWLDCHRHSPNFGEMIEIKTFTFESEDNNNE